MRVLNALKTEIYRIIHNGLFTVLNVILFFVILLHIVIDVLPASKCILAAEYPETVFRYWLGMDFSSGFSVGYYMVVPGLAALIPCATYVYERRNGYCNLLIVKTGRKEACIARLLSVFLIGGAISSFPLLLDYLIVAVLLPSVRPIAATFFYTVNGDDFLSGIFYTHPTAYVVLRIIIVFGVVGALSVMCFLSEKLIANEYAAIVFPFACFMGLHVLFTFGGKGEYSPYNVISPGNSGGVTWAGVLMLMVGFLIIGGFFALLEVQRYEV